MGAASLLRFRRQRNELMGAYKNIISAQTIYIRGEPPLDPRDDRVVAPIFTATVCCYIDYSCVM